MVSKFKMAASDLVSVRGQVMEYTYILTGIKGEMVRSGVPVEISRYSCRVFVFVCPSVISSIPGKSFHFPFP